MIIRNSAGQTISSVEEWFQYAPPKKGALQWKDYRSAKELAKAWIASGPPPDLRALLDSHPDFRGCTIEEAVPEYQIPLDSFAGEPRNADLLLVGRGSDGPIVITIEAKADEAFGPRIGEYVRQKEGTGSKVPERVSGLLSAVFGKPLDEQLGEMRYQLLHGAAATLIEAKKRGAVRAAFVVHEFHSSHLNAEKVTGNARDWEHFIAGLAACTGVSVAPRGLSGPFRLPGGGLVPGDIPLFLGKISTRLQ